LDPFGSLIQSTGLNLGIPGRGGRPWRGRGRRRRTKVGHRSTRTPGGSEVLPVTLFPTRASREPPRCQSSLRMSSS
jgi:hypothetical protein